MLRKIFICFFVVLLMTTLVVPAFATSSGGHNGVSGPAFTIDYFRIVSGSGKRLVGDWPNNFASGDSNSVSGSYTGIASFECSYDNTSFETSLYPAAVGKIELHISDMFLTADTVFTLDDDGFEHVRFSTITVSGFVVNVTDSRNESAYHTSLRSFSGSYSANSSEVDLASIIALYCNLSSATGSPTFISSLDISISYYSVDPDISPSLHFTVSRQEYVTPFLAWFNNLNLTSRTEVVSAPGWFDWLLDSINAFLNFEIVPNFSLNRIFYIVLVIGVLLWFITLLI